MTIQENADFHEIVFFSFLILTNLDKAQYIAIVCLYLNYLYAPGN